MQGILVVDKPEGFTSFDVVAKLRGICGTRRIGHGGTLDPMATGVLPVFVGGAAKAVDMQERADKMYTATMLLGRRTDTGDVTGETLEQAAVPADIGLDAVAAVLPRFTGTQQQVPPMYSAVKVNGQPLYKAARAGKTVERTPRPVTLHSIMLAGSPAPNEYILNIHCSKGTYVRVLLEDIGRALGVPATMAALRRTASGPYTLEMAYTLDELQRAREAGTLESLLLRAGETVPVHEFHYWDSTENGAAFNAQKPATGRSWTCGFAGPALYAAFPHLYFAGRPQLAERCVRAAAAFQSGR